MKKFYISLIGIIIAMLVLDFVDLLDFNNQNNDVTVVPIEQVTKKKTVKVADKDLLLANLNKKYGNYIASVIQNNSEYYCLPLSVVCTLIDTESEFKIKAISRKGRNFGIGLTQVSKIALLDYNWKNDTTYTQKDLFNPDINLKIGLWSYIQNRQYCKIKNLSYSELYVAYNIGCNQYDKYCNYYTNNIYPNGNYYGALKRFNIIYTKYM